MDTERFEHHLTSPQGRGRIPAGAFIGSAGGAACCDQISIGLVLNGASVAEAGFSARGCGTAVAAASAAVLLARARPVLEVARLGTTEIAEELGGLSPGKLHAAELASDALHRALGSAARDSAQIAERSGATLVAMSGGVDSAVAALLSMGEAPVLAATLELWADPENDPERSCCSASAVRQARVLAHGMGIPHLTIDLRGEFRAGVVDPFLAGYAAGETPNPCVSCNGHVRLDALLALADRLGCERLATGHYARVAERDDPGGPLLRAAADPAKDQAYMLAALEPRSLGRMNFPLGELTKGEVRELARAAGLPVAAKADSQDLCFLAGTGRAGFLARHGGLGERRGLLVDERGTVLGTHRGQHHYTVGQRRGIGVGGGRPLYVLDKSVAANRVTVGPRRGLETDHVTVRAVHLRRAGRRVNHVKLRYRSRALAARLEGDPAPGRHRRLRVVLADHVDRPAPGQLACLMDGETIVGWGTIARPVGELA